MENWSVECPFTSFGCDQGKLKRDVLNEHLKQESYRHNEILIDIIGNLRNELAELKRDREKCNATIDKLVKSDREKAVIIDSMRLKMELLEKAVLEQRVDNLGNILDGKTDKIESEIEAKLVEMKREWRGPTEQKQLVLANVEERNEVKYRTEIAGKIDSVAKCLTENIGADFIWTIDNVTEKRQKEEPIDSEYFNGSTEPYKMQLGCANGASKLRFHLRIYRGDNDESLQWPFDRNVTIAIINQIHPKSCKSITKHCTIANPSNSKYLFIWSDPFKFEWNELTDEELLHENRLIVQCFIRN